MPTLLDHVLRLARALGAPTDAEAVAAIERRIAREDLTDPAAVPPWLLDVLDALATGRQIPRWQRFDASGDLTDQLEFFRTLHTLLPVQVEDIGVRYTLTAPALDLEAVVALEGYVYLVRRIGDPEP